MKSGKFIYIMVNRNCAFKHINSRFDDTHAKSIDATFDGDNGVSIFSVIEDM